ncbi:MAG: hypothetical protein Ct9H300mP25_15750 [Acidobacteriota bacterium]|nr:MAG: hypothetical protein Ct9H300mP25_15750 [Acidobacteriota bacterium]
MGRAEAYAMQNPPTASLVDGFGNGLGYGAILMVTAFVRGCLVQEPFLVFLSFLLRPKGVGTRRMA